MEELTTRELRKEIRDLIKKYPKMRDYISEFEKFTGLKYSGKLSVSQLNDLIFWCLNSQMAEEKRSNIGGLI